MPPPLNFHTTTRLGSNDSDTVTVVHSGAWLTVANASTLVLQLGELVLQGGTFARTTCTLSHYTRAVSHQSISPHPTCAK